MANTSQWEGERLVGKWSENFCSLAVKCHSHTIAEAKKAARLLIMRNVPTNTKLQVPLEDRAPW